MSSNYCFTGMTAEIKNWWQQKSLESKIQFSFERAAEAGTFAYIGSSLLSRGALQGAWRGGQYLLRTTTSRFLRRQLASESNTEIAKGPKEGLEGANKVLRQKFQPDQAAEGAHSVFRRNMITGKTEKYQT